MAYSILGTRYVEIPEYENYGVSACGKVVSLVDGTTRRTWVGKVVATAVDHDGYETICLFKQGEKNKYTAVHRLVARAYLGVRPKGFVINHKDGNKLNNKVENLEYCTNSENMLHAYKQNPDMRIVAAKNALKGRNSENYKKAMKIYLASDALKDRLRSQATKASRASKTPEAIEKWKQSIRKKKNGA